MRTWARLTTQASLNVALLDLLTLNTSRALSAPSHFVLLSADTMWLRRGVEHVVYERTSSALYPEPAVVEPFVRHTGGLDISACANLCPAGTGTTCLLAPRKPAQQRERLARR